jgi:hypothetical protein
VGSKTARTRHLQYLGGRNWLARSKDHEVLQFDSISPRISSTASTSKSRASGTRANLDDAQVNIDRGTCGL